MRFQTLHSWDVTPREAQDIQRRLAPRVNLDPPPQGEPRLVAGLDLSPPDQENTVCGAAVVVRYASLDVVEVKRAFARLAFPYVPGLLSFREAPALLAALERLVTLPDVVLVDGQGLAHPRRFGLACHIGVLIDRPTIGCAKSILRGTYSGLATERGAVAHLVDEGVVVGAALRTRPGVSPIYVSVGHRVDLPTALRWVLGCCGGYRMPEPTRLAHQAAAGRLPEREPVTASATDAERQGHLPL